MTRPLRWQSALFLVASLGTSTLALGGARFEPRTELLVSTVLIGLLGIPHGAIDPLLAAATYDLRRPADWCWFAASYVAVALTVVLVWLFAPMLFLVGFLVVSVVHFSDDLAPGVSWISRVAYGASVVVLPTVRHTPEIARLLGLVAGADAAGPVVAVLAVVAWPVMVVATWRAMALTVPHMALVEAAARAGWPRSAHGPDTRPDAWRPPGAMAPATAPPKG